MLLYHLDLLRMMLQVLQALRWPAFELGIRQGALMERRQCHFPTEPTGEVLLHKRLQKPAQTYIGESSLIAAVAAPSWTGI
eukprot:CAMPEP_0172681852 /NCGR_PEP_ID=MMETSP1074-20121228/17749_1 /TAXON_ID=2916 /ORGANISM="Ceratium fusus, Strain PA161109" /LENGTH=80 /DNA_ID=CAMNT_0013500423 /DNA_START=64 /DNA_END=303 /DNA_ORIENTATION=-